MNIKNWLYFASLQLKKVSSSPHLDAEIILSYCLNKTHSWIICRDNLVLSKYNLYQLKQLLKRRMCSEPIAYLINKKEFWSLSLMVSNFTLIPRPETEVLVEKALFYLIDRKQSLILDLGTGCGSIALAIASMRSDCFVLGVDYSYESIKLAKKNADNLGLANVDFFYSNWFSNINYCFEMIVSNPPYISISEIQFLSKEVLFEPILALISSNNGLGALCYIIKTAKKYLYSGGWLLVEHSSTQKVIVQNLFGKYNYINIQTYLDIFGKYRITSGQKQ